jgi:sensor c-di-GMP phosphodiesterase-like protein
MNKSYWNQKASAWVSMAVLAGGMVSAIMLFILVRVDSSLQNLSTRIGNIEEVLNDPQIRE